MNSNAKLLRAVCLMVKHAFMHKEVYGVLPNHRYMMEMFGVEYEFADHVLNIAALVDTRKVSSWWTLKTSD